MSTLSKLAASRGVHILSQRELVQIANRFESLLLKGASMEDYVSQNE